MAKLMSRAGLERMIADMEFAGWDATPQRRLLAAFPELSVTAEEGAAMVASGEVTTPPPRHPHAGCDQCGAAGPIMNIGEQHWSFCSEHRTAWCLHTDGRWTAWKGETLDRWQENARRLATLRVVGGVQIPTPAELAARYAGWEPAAPSEALF